MESYNFYIVWNSYDDEKFRIGILYKRDTIYCFQYNHIELQKALDKGGNIFPCFPVKTKKYYSKNLFPVFKSRISPEDRVDIHDLLKKYGLEMYNEMELLRATKGILPTDRFELELFNCCI